MVSFAWGAAYFHEVPPSWSLAGLALLLLITGVTGISLCSIQKVVSLPSYLRCLYIIPCLKDVEQTLLPNPSINESEPLLAEKEPKPYSNNLLLGMVAAVSLGFINGSRLVPSKITATDQKGIPYAVCFSVGVAMVTLVISLVYFFIQWVRGNGGPKFHLRVAFLPGILAGLTWNMGNVCSIYATELLGLSIGFPLTQTALLVSGLWGLLLFREITRPSAIIIFFCSAVILLAGAVLLSVFGGKVAR